MCRNNTVEGLVLSLVSGIHWRSLNVSPVDKGVLCVSWLKPRIIFSQLSLLHLSMEHHPHFAQLPLTLQSLLLLFDKISGKSCLFYMSHNQCFIWHCYTFFVVFLFFSLISMYQRHIFHLFIPLLFPRVAYT